MCSPLKRKKMTVCKIDSEYRSPVPVSDSATQRILINKRKISLLSTLNEVLKERRTTEHRRNALLQSAAIRQHQVQDLKIKCNSAWQEKIAEAQSIAAKWEMQCATLREKREVLQKQLLNCLEGAVPAKISNDAPSIRANYKMQAVQLQKEIADLKRRVSNAKFRVDQETKNRDNLHNSVKKLRNEAGVKKIHMAAIRPQTLAMVSHPAQCRPAREHLRLKKKIHS